MNAMTQDIDIDEEFKRTKGRLFMAPRGQTRRKGAGFLGSLLCKLSFQWTTEIPTAAISATTLYWNPDWFRTLSREMRVTVLAHELWHNALMHVIRRGDRCPDIWNIAGDHVINNMLEDHGYIFEGPCCKNPKYKGWSTDQVYDDLIANGQPQRPLGDVIGGDIKAMTGDPDKVKATVISNVLSAMTTARITNSAGDIPGEVVSILDEFLHPKLPWEVILFNFFNALTSEEYSYARPNRRYQDPLLPGITGRNGLEHLVYFVDASASITDDQILRMHSEVKHIQEDLRPEKLTLITFDTKIQDTRVFEIDEPYAKIEIHGRGGTDLEDCWEFLQREQPTAAVVLSDLYVNIPENPGIPIIWVCIDNPAAEVPYGQLVHLSV